MTEQGPKPKVARLIDTHDLNGLGDDLVERWTRTENRSSLRQLATRFNQRLLRAQLEGQGEDSLEGEVENLYQLLTDDDVTSGVRQEARDHLERRGVDVDSLEGDFVSYQAIRTYLKNHRDASPPDETVYPEQLRSEKSETIQRLKNRLQKVARQALEDLRNAGHITLGDFNVVVNVRVHCTDCNSQRSVSEILSSGGCDCSQ